MAEQSKINQTSASPSQLPENPPNTVPDPLPKPIPRKYSTQTTRKITQSNLDIHNSPYFKIRSLVQELRPLFLEILQTPDFQNCNGAHEIRKQLAEMRLMMDLYKQMTMEAAPTGKFKNVPEHQPSSSTSLLGKEPQPGGRPSNRSKPRPPERVPTFEKPLQPPNFSFSDSQHPMRSYIVGGSSLGLNFITYRGSEPVHYGMTKEMHRDSLAQKKVVSP